MQTTTIPVAHIQGDTMPRLGLGTWELRGAACVDAVQDALNLGYRHIDTAQMYENEIQVGEGLLAAGVPRKDIFLTTKLAPGNLSADRVRETLNGSLDRLGSDYVDLLLIHWPDPKVPLAETVEAMLELQRENRVRHIGVSNFPPSLVEEACGLGPIFCNQVEYHPWLPQGAVHEKACRHDHVLMAYCPLARGRVLEDPTIQLIAARHGRSPAEVVLAWLLGQDHVAAIPKAASSEHRRSNLAACELELDTEERGRIDALGHEHQQRLIDPEWAPDWER